MFKLKLQYFGHLIQRTNSLEKTLMLGKVEKGMTEAEMVGWHHRLNGHESEQAPGVGDGQGGLACCSPQGRKESDTTERLNKNPRPVSSPRGPWLTTLLNSGLDLYFVSLSKSTSGSDLL